MIGRRTSFRSERGTLLVVAMVFGALLAVALGSFVSLNTHSLKMSLRSHFAAEATNMAESGLEEAIWSFNQAQSGDPDAWIGWSIGGPVATRIFSDFNLGANATGAVKIFVDSYNPAPGDQPTIVAEASVTLPNGQGVVSRTVEIKLKRRSYFAAGLVAKDGVTFSGNNASVDSWISDPDNDAGTAAIPYSTAVRRDRGSIGAASVNATISLNNADIWGTASVGGTSLSAISVGPNGRVGPFGTESGVKDPASIATDFRANFDPIGNPGGGTVLATLGSELGTAGTTTFWRAPQLTDSIMIHGDVTLVLTAGPAVSAIDITGMKIMTVAVGSRLSIYTEGDVKIAGQGLLNENDSPETFQLWGTSTSAIAQDIQIEGNGALKGVIYAPNGDIKINGNGDVMGAAVGRKVTLTGNAAFHYDESLANWRANSPFGIVRWRELRTRDEKAVHVTHLSF
jgi:Tfp pilus assembly protein PilX